ncbi:MAG TPA: hypothetical protein VGG10_06800 [Rhizomicrobium sp.]|jgi:hypothetical protein
MRSLRIGVAMLLASSGSAEAQQPFAAGDFASVAGLTSDSQISDARALYGLGFLAGNKKEIAFTHSGADGTTYRLDLTFGVEVSVDCGFFGADAKRDAVYMLCQTRGTDAVRALLANGQDRNRFLSLIGGSLKGVQYDYGKELVSVSMPDPDAKPASVTVAWCLEAGC